MSDLYAILGVTKAVNDDGIKKAYRKLAMQWHPDKWSNGTNEERKTAEEKFKEITQAYEILNDSDKRQKYDQFGMDYFTKGGQDGPDMSNFFSQMGGFGPFAGFGGMQRQKREPTMPHIVQKINVTLQQAYCGAEIDVSFDRYDIKKDTTVEKTDVVCSTCKGQGTIIQMRQMGPMIQQSQQTCQSCKGEGIILSNKYFDKKKHKFNFSINKGVSSNDKVQIHDQGNQLPQCFKDNREFAGRDRTNVLLVFDVQNEVIIDGKKFTRGVNGDVSNVHVELSIDLHEAICGVRKNIKYLDGKILCIEIPSVISMDKKVVIVKNKGMSHFKNDDIYGDLFITVKINKKNLNNEQKTKIWKILSNTDIDTEDKKFKNNDVLKVETIDNYKPSNNSRHHVNDDDDDDDDDGRQFGGGQSQCTQQ